MECIRLVGLTPLVTEIMLVHQHPADDYAFPIDKIPEYVAEIRRYGKLPVWARHCFPYHDPEGYNAYNGFSVPYYREQIRRVKEEAQQFGCLKTCLFMEPGEAEWDDFSDQVKNKELSPTLFDAIKAAVDIAAEKEGKVSYVYGSWSHFPHGFYNATRGIGQKGIDTWFYYDLSWRREHPAFAHEADYPAFYLKPSSHPNMKVAGMPLFDSYDILVTRRGEWEKCALWPKEYQFTPMVAKDIYDAWQRVLAEADSASASADLDDDGDVDGYDFVTFSLCFNGSLNPPNCF